MAFEYQPLAKWRKFLPNFFIRNITKKQKYRYARFLKILGLLNNGYSQRKISKMLSIERKIIYSWLKGFSKPIIAYLYDLIKDKKTISEDEFIVPFGRPPSSHAFVNKVWILPRKIKDFNDIKKVVKQLLGYTPAKKDLESFAFLVGYYLSDGSHNAHVVEGRIRAHCFEADVLKTERNYELLKHLQMIITKLGFNSKIIVNNRKGGNELLLFTTYTYFFDYLRYIIVGIKDGSNKTYNKPLYINWILKSPTRFQKYVLKGLVEGDGGLKTGHNVLGISCYPIIGFVKKICKNLGLKTWVGDNRIYIRFYHKTIKNVLNVCFLPEITTDKKLEFSNWSKKLLKQKKLTLQNSGKLPRNSIKKLVLEFVKSKHVDDGKSIYQLAKENGYHLVTVLNILKGRTRQKEVREICKTYNLSLPWDFIKNGGEKVN